MLFNASVLTLQLTNLEPHAALRDLVDFLPASFATIISYFSAEITRGIWKPVSMNGIDWPSPAANLVSLESEMKEILASAGVHIPSCCACKFSYPYASNLFNTSFLSMAIIFFLLCLGVWSLVFS